MSIMENIINQILEIDEKARQMIANAEKQKREILDKAHDSEVTVKEEWMERAKSRIESVEEVKRAESEEQILEINRQKQEKINKLDKAYNDNHIKWEKEILKNIIGQ